MTPYQLLPFFSVEPIEQVKAHENGIPPSKRTKVTISEESTSAAVVEGEYGNASIAAISDTLRLTVMYGYKPGVWV